MKTLITSFLIILNTVTFAQFVSREIPTSEVESVQYDGSKPFYGYKDLNQYIGERIYFPKQSVVNPKYNPEKTAVSSGSFYQEIPQTEETETNVYKPIKISYNYYTDRSTIEGRSFNILDIVDRSELSSSEKNRAIFLKLKDEKTSDVLFYQLASKREALRADTTPDFYLSKRFDFLNSHYKGKLFTAKESVLEVSDVITGATITVEKGSTWIFHSYALFSLPELDYEYPFMVFKNEKGNEVLVYRGPKNTHLDGVKLSIWDFTMNE